MLLVVLLVLLLSILTYRLINNQLFWYHKEVKQNFPVPIFGDFWKALLKIQTMFDVINDNYTKFKNERYFGLYQMTIPCLVIRDLELIQKISGEDFEYFTDHYSFVPIGKNSTWSKNLFYSKGKSWKRIRAISKPIFTFNKAKSMYPLINECAERFARHYDQQTSKELAIETWDSLSRYVSDVIGTCGFGIKCDSLKNRNNLFYLMGREATDYYSFWSNLKILLFAAFPKIYKLLDVQFPSARSQKFFLSLVKETIKLRERQRIIRPDMLHILNEARKENSKSVMQFDFKAYTESDITGQLFDAFYAGFILLTGAISFLLYELTVNTDIQSKVQAEIDMVWRNCNGKVTYDDVCEMKYLDMVVCETLRKWPPNVLTDRVCVKPYTIATKESGVTIKVGDIVLIPTIAIHRDPEYYPDPERFDPERFNDCNKHKIKEYSYMPFGCGPRSCPGAILALLKMKVLCFNLLRRFDFVRDEKTSVPFKLSKKSFHLLPDGGGWIRLRKRGVN